jgi:organic radical activating enzyme
MWNLDILTSKLKELGCTIHIETSGAYPMSGHWTGLPFRQRKQDFLKKKFIKSHELKVIVFNNHDFKFAQSRLQKFLKTATLSSERMEQKK